MTRIKPVLQTLLLGAACSLLNWTVMAQEPLSKSGEPHKVAAPAKEERYGVHESGSRLVQRSRCHRGTGEAGTTAEGRGESLAGGFRHSYLRERDGRIKTITET